MKSMNRVQLIGYLGKDILVKTAKDGSSYASLRIATDHFHKNTHGEATKKTNWHTVRIWDTNIVEKHKHNLITGSHVLVEGFINYRDYTDREGRYNHIAEIKATTLVDLDR
jgi:single-strand DNA-binding protein